MSMVLEVDVHRRAPNTAPNLRLVPKLSSYSESLVVELSAATLREEFESVAMPYSGALYAMAYRLCGRSAQAEDLVQEAYITAWKRFGEFERGSNFKAWIFQILMFHHMNARRALKHEPVSIEVAGQAVQAKISNDTANDGGGTSAPYSEAVDDEFKRALDRLDDAHRSVLLMVALGELSYQECAEALKVPVGTVMSRLFRARKQLQDELAEYAKSKGYTGRQMSKKGGA